MSAKLKFNDENKITGRNLLVFAPIQTADTDNYGGKMLYLGLGVNLLAKLLHKKIVLTLNYYFLYYKIKTTLRWLQTKRSYLDTRRHLENSPDEFMRLKLVLLFHRCQPFEFLERTYVG